MDCTGRHFQRTLPSEGQHVWLLLCTGCPSATLVVGSRPIDEYASAQEAEDAYKNMIMEGAFA